MTLNQEWIKIQTFNKFNHFLLNNCCSTTELGSCSVLINVKQHIYLCQFRKGWCNTQFQTLFKQSWSSCIMKWSRNQACEIFLFKSYVFIYFSLFFNIVSSDFTFGPWIWKFYTYACVIIVKDKSSVSGEHIFSYAEVTRLKKPSYQNQVMWCNIIFCCHNNTDILHWGNGCGGAPVLWTSCNTWDRGRVSLLCDNGCVSSWCPSVWQCTGRMGTCGASLALPSHRLQGEREANNWNPSH